MPSRSEIDPVDLPALLPHMFLVDVLDNPRDFRFRLAGTHLREFTGMEVTGRCIGEVFPSDFCAEVHYHWNRCVDCRKLAVGSGRLWLPEKSHVHWEGVVLPLSVDGFVVNMFLGGVIFMLGSSG